MSDSSNYKAEVAQCFSNPENVEKCNSCFFIGDTHNMDCWKATSVRACNNLIEMYLQHWENNKSKVQYADVCDDEKSILSNEEEFYQCTKAPEKKRRIVPYTKPELEQFVYALQSCIPLFGHLYHKNFNSLSQCCWCPCCPPLQGWRDVNHLSFIKISDICQYSLPSDRGNLIQHLNHYKQRKHILHELTHVFLNSYSQYFKSMKKGTSDFDQEMTFRRKPISLISINPYLSDLNTNVTTSPHEPPIESSSCSSKSNSVFKSSYTNINTSSDSLAPSYQSTSSKARKKGTSKHQSFDLGWRRTRDRRGNRIYYYNKKFAKKNPGLKERPTEYDTDFDSNLSSTSHSSDDNKKPRFKKIASKKTSSNSASSSLSDTSKDAKVDALISQFYKLTKEMEEHRKIQVPTSNPTPVQKVPFEETMKLHTSLVIKEVMEQLLEQNNQNKRKSKSSNWDNHNMPWGNTDSHWGVRNTSWGDENQSEFVANKRKSDSSNCSKSTSTAKRSCPPQNSVSSFTQSTTSKVDEKKSRNKSTTASSNVTLTLNDIDAPLKTNRAQKSPHDKAVPKKSAHKYRTVKRKAKDARARVRNNKLKKEKNRKKMQPSWLWRKKKTQQKMVV